MAGLEGIIGLAMRAGRIACGEENCLKLIKRGAACLMLLDAGISPASAQPLKDACLKRGIEYIAVPEGALGQATGKYGRMAAVVTDEGLAARLKQIAQQITD